MESEQIFGQVLNYHPNEKPLLSLVDVILGLSTLTLIIIFVSFGFLADFKEKSEIEENFVIHKPAMSAIDKTQKITTATISEKVVKPKITTAAISKKVVKPPLKELIYQALLKEFQYDLPHWFASIDRHSLTIGFQNPLIKFQVGHWSLNQPHQSILIDFFPRYIKVLRAYKSAIEALSIEGHTSSEWQNSISEDEAYFSNMALSQERTRAVLEYCLQLPSITNHKEWLHSILTANGLSSSRLIFENGFENVEHSRRVEFRIRLLEEHF